MDNTPPKRKNGRMSAKISKRNQLTARQKNELTLAVKKTVKQYSKTLKLLAKT